jgi:NitT/TauT family transport system permease protein
MSWLLLIVAYWFIMTSGTKKLFPSPDQVWHGFVALYNEGLVVHIGSSLLLCLQATLISIVFSFYLTILVTNARSMQIWVLVIFMSLYFITSLLAVIKDVSQEEIDHARSLKCSRWEILWEVIIKGRLDYVIDVLRQNLAITWMMLVTVESILVAAGGLGVLIKNSDKFMNHGRILALQIVILLVGLGIDFALTSLRKSAFRYSKFN